MHFIIVILNSTLLLAFVIYLKSFKAMKQTKTDNQILLDTHFSKHKKKIKNYRKNLELHQIPEKFHPCFVTCLLALSSVKKCRCLFLQQH